jgi:hypothetical protein
VRRSKEVTVLQLPVRFGQGGNEGDGDPADGAFGPLSFTLQGDDLPYKVEVWEADGASIERVIAIAADGTIGYAAFYAAARDNPGRDITLSYKGNVLSRWNRQSH